MSRPPSAAATLAADIRQLLAAYVSLPYTLPSFSRDRYVSPRLKKLRSATRPSERASLALQLADRCFDHSDFDSALTFYTASLTSALACSSLEAAHVITLLRRLGEVQHALTQYPAAIDTFHAALSLLPLLPSSTSPRWRLHLPQGVHLCLGNAFLHWADDETIPLHTGHARVTEAVHWYRLSVREARQIAELKTGGRGGGGGGRGAASGVSGVNAVRLINAYVNLGNGVVQQIHFDNYELRARHRGAGSDSVAPLMPLDLPLTDLSSSAATDPLTAPVDATLSSLSLSELIEHRRQRFLAGTSLFDSALALAVSYDKVDEQLMVWDNLATLYEAVEDFDQASACIDKAEEAGKALGAMGYEWRLKRMIMWMRAERWIEALREARLLREMIEQRADEQTTREVEQEGRQAMLDVEWVESMWAKVQRKQQLQEDIARLRLPSQLTAESEEEKKEEESQDTEEGRSRAQVSMLHALVQICLSLAASNVGLHLHYATALDAHRNALSLLSTSDRSFPRLSLSAHSFHVHTLVRYLPWLVRMKRDSEEVHDVVQRGEQSMQAAKAALAQGGAGPAGGEEEIRVKGLLAWLEGQLRLQCGWTAKEVMAALQSGLQTCCAGGVVREWLLVQMQHMVVVLSTEAEDEMEGVDNADVVKEKKAEVAAALLQTRRWCRSHPREAQEERAFLRWGLWMLDRLQAEEDEEDEQREGQQQSERRSRSSREEEDDQGATELSDADDDVVEEEAASPSEADDAGEVDDDDDFMEVERSVAARPSRRRRPAASASPSPPHSPSPPTPTHYDVDDDDEDDALLTERTAQARLDRELKQVKAGRAQQPRAKRTTDSGRRRTGRTGRASHLSSSSEADWIIDDRVDHSQREPKAKLSSSSSSRSAACAAPSRRSTRVRGAGVTAFVRQQMIAMRLERIKTGYGLPYVPDGAIVTVGEQEEDDAEVYEREVRDAPHRSMSRDCAQPVRLSLSLNNLRELAGDDSDTTMAMDDGRPSASVTTVTIPSNNRQSHSMPLSILDGGGRGDDSLLLPSLPPLRHSIDALIEGAAFSVELAPLLTTARDPLRPSDLDLDLISIPALLTLINRHVKRQTGRECTLQRLVQRGEDVVTDASVLFLFRRQEVGQERPLVIGVVQEWKAISPFDCYTAVCSSHSPPLHRHPLITRQLHPHGMEPLLTFPSAPPSTLTSSCLRALFLALRVEQAALTSLALPRIGIDADTVDCLVETIEVSLFSHHSLTLRRAYIQRCPDQRPLLSAVAPSASPSASSLPLSRLRSIRLSHSLLSSLSLSRLLLSLSLLPALTSLDASYTAVNDACLPSLSFLAQHAQSLSSLSLRSTRLTGSSTLLLSAFASALSANTTLTSVDLGHNDWTVDSLTVLLPALSSLPTLFLLSLSHTSPSPSSLRLFLASLARSGRWLHSLNLDQVDALHDQRVWLDLLYIAVGGARGVGKAAACALQEIRVRGGALHHDQRRMVDALHSRGTRTPFVLVD